MRTYEDLRADLNEPDRIAQGMRNVFAQMALLESCPTAVVITAAALDLPIEAIADLIGYHPAKVDAAVATFCARLARQLRGERERRAA